MKQSVYKSYDELPLFFNAELVGKVLGISSTSAYELMHREDFPSIKIGNRLIVSKEKFIEWANKQSDANATSKSDFVTQAIDFYIGYLRQKKCADFISPILAQSIKSEISSVEENISKMLFKLSVEQSIVNNLIASQNKIDEHTMERLRISCAEEVARLGGIVTFEDAYEWQHGE